MNEGKKNLAEKIQQYHFELKHVLVLFIILAAAQVLVSFVHKVSLQNFLVKAQNSYQQDSAERLANLTATSLELLLETSAPSQVHRDLSRRKIIEAFNIILSQQLLLRQVEEICILVELENKVYAIDNGAVLY